LYEYRCSSCGSRFELLRRMSQGNEGVVCPECGKDEVEKEYSTFAGATSGGAAGGGSCASSGRFT